jgi:hypothetical protein
MYTAIIQSNGQTIGVVALDPKVFGTGSTGYKGQGKVVSTDGKYQVQVQAVLIGSKPKVADEM